MSNMTEKPDLSPLMGWLQIDQIAFAARTEAEAGAIKRSLRLQDAKWIQDEVVAEGFVKRNGDYSRTRIPNDLDRNTAILEFNYDLGIELEILRYTAGANYVAEWDVKGLCHIGTHVKPDAPSQFLSPDARLFSPIVQKVETVSHTNPYLLERGRHYRYTIYDTRDTLGAFFKTIERMGDG